jgi:hypothetical protein
LYHLSVASVKENSFVYFSVIDGSEDISMAVSSKTTGKSATLDDAPNL